MTAVPPCPHYLVTLFLSKVIFFPLVFLIFAPYFSPPTDSSWCRSQMDLEFLLWSSPRPPPSVPSLSSWFQFHIHFSASKAFLTSCHPLSLVLYCCLGFLFCWALIFAGNNSIMIPSFPVPSSPYFALCSKYPVTETQPLREETDLVSASTRKPLMTAPLSASQKQSHCSHPCAFFNSRKFLPGDFFLMKNGEHELWNK